MTAELTPEQRKFFEQPNFGFLATVMPDGSPQVTPMWVDVEDGTIVVNTAIGRVKERNVRRDPRVAIAVVAQDNPYNQVAVRGEIVEATEEGAVDHIDALAAKYIGQSTYPWLQPGERRIKFRIRPHSVS